MILSPWFWLGILIWTAMVGAGAYLKGSNHAQDAARAAHAAALEQTIKDANERAQIDAQALIDHERARQEVRTVYLDKVRTITETIYASPTNCTVPVNYRVRLNSLIDAANSAPVAKHAVLPADPKAGK